MQHDASDKQHYIYISVIIINDINDNYQSTPEIKRQRELFSCKRQRESEILRKKKTKGKPQRRRRSAQTPGVPTSLPLEPALKTPPCCHPGEIAAWRGPTHPSPATLPWRRPPLALGGRPRIVILCRRGAASIPHESTTSFVLPSRTPVTLSRVFAHRGFPARASFLLAGFLRASSARARGNVPFSRQISISPRSSLVNFTWRFFLTALLSQASALANFGVHKSLLYWL